MASPQISAYAALMKLPHSLALGASFFLAACNPNDPPITSGTDIEPGPYGRGVVIVDGGLTYESTNISLVGINGARLSQSFISSASLLSGDVVVPTMPITGPDAVLLDRKNNLVSWVNFRTAAIREQFHTNDDGLAENPWDYLPISDEKAYVTRYDPQPQGAKNGDIIVVDPQKSTVTTPIKQRIDIAKTLNRPSDIVIHPARGLIIDDRALVLTVNATIDYVYTTSNLVVLNTQTDEIITTLEIPDLHDCTSLAVSPDKKTIAITCSGDLQANGKLSLDTSGLVLLDAETLTEKGRFEAAHFQKGVLGLSVSFATNSHVLVTLLGNLDQNIDDVAALIDITNGETTTIHTTPPFRIGGVLCPARLDENTNDPLPPACFITDADQNALLLFPSNEGELGDPTPITVDEQVGLPPLHLGQF